MKPTIGSVWRRGLYERHMVEATAKKEVRTREMDKTRPLHFVYSRQEFNRWFWQDDGSSHCDCAECKAIDNRMAGLCGRT